MSFSIKSLIIFVLLLSTIVSNGQYGVRLAYDRQNFNPLSDILQKNNFTNKDVYLSAFEVGANYWFRMKKKRIEFLPELAFKYANEAHTGYLTKLQWSSYHLNLPIQIYALDLKDDCNCPTFSKQGSGINKGLFFMVNPGIGYYSNIFQIDNIVDINFDTPSGFLAQIGIGVGLDLGINELLTITPMISYNFSSAIDWDHGIETNTTRGPTRVYPRILQLGIRMGFRPDYYKKFGRRR